MQDCVRQHGCAALAHMCKAEGIHAGSGEAYRPCPMGAEGVRASERVRASRRAAHMLLARARTHSDAGESAAAERSLRLRETRETGPVARR